MKKVFIVLVLSLILISYITGCSTKKEDQNPPSLSISIGNQHMECKAIKKVWDGTVYDVKNPFVSVFEQSPEEIKLIHADFGEKVTLNADGKLPDSITVKDDILKDNGEYKYADKVTVDVPVTASDNKFSFMIEKNLASALSSLYVENGTDIRGYRITATWGDNVCIYAFMIRTDSL